MRSFNIKALREIARDTRGAVGYVEMLIMVICVALFGLAAFQYLGGEIDTKVREAADEIPNIGQ